MSKWKPLQQGDIVEIVAPASKSSMEGLQKAAQFVRKLGLQPRVPEDVFGGREQFCAHSDSQRFYHLKKAIYARDSKAIWSLRGGWGSARLLPSLSRLKHPRQSKLFIGYSDLTTLHLFFNSFWNWTTLHGSMLVELGQGESKGEEWSDFRKLIFGETKCLEYKGLIPLNDKARSERLIQSRVMGGNLTLLQSNLGTPWQSSLKGKILVLEDVGEKVYWVDRRLVHLQQANFFKGVSAIIFGNFIGESHHRLWKYVREDFAQRLSIPILKGLPLGHGGHQRPMPFLTKAHLKLGEKWGRLKVHSGSTN